VVKPVSSDGPMINGGEDSHLIGVPRQGIIPLSQAGSGAVRILIARRGERLLLMLMSQGISGWVASFALQYLDTLRRRDTRP